MQLPAWSLRRSLRYGPSSELPIWLRGDCRGLRPKGIFLPTPASPRGRTRLEWISSSGDHQQSSSAQGPRGSPIPLWPMETRGLGEKKGSVALLSKGALGLRFVPRRESTFPECSSLHGVWSGARDVVSVLRSPAGSGWIAGACAQKAFSCQHLFLQEGEKVWSGFPAQETTSKAAGPREPEAAQTLFALWRPEG